MADREERTVRSFCRLCTAICGIVVDVVGDGSSGCGVTGRTRSRGGYTCPEGRALPAFHHHPDRIERPMLRIDGQLTPSTWEASPAARPAG